jgi:isopentenyl phosphate kinase
LLLELTFDNMAESKKIVLKLGGSILTKKDTTDFPIEIQKIKDAADEYIRYDVIRKIGNEMKEALEQDNIELILVNGAGPFGHFLVKNRRPDEEVRESVRHLNNRIVSELKKIGLKIVPIAPSKSCEFVRGEFDISYLWEVTSTLLEEGKILSTYGDMLNGGKVISGDDLVVLLAKVWKADEIITATDVDGVFTRDPKTNKDVEFIGRLGSDSNGNVEYTTSNIDVTGGMVAKVEKLKSAAKQGTECRVINGLKEGNIKAALLGDKSIGTFILG